MQLIFLKKRSYYDKKFRWEALWLFLIDKSLYALLVIYIYRKNLPNSLIIYYFSASAIMSTKLTVSNLPNFRKSTLALHRINSMVNGNNESTQSTNHEGFDDLRHFIKAGGEFSKELASTLADRAELEATYAKGLSKLAAKLFKVSF